jgi:hypothetical protein
MPASPIATHSGITLAPGDNAIFFNVREFAWMLGKPCLPAGSVLEVLKQKALKTLGELVHVGLWAPCHESSRVMLRHVILMIRNITLNNS